jgi:hypothetical protein
MREFLLSVMNWSEVWAPLIPLTVLLYKKNQPRFLRPVIVYLFFALFINLAGDLIDVTKHSLPSWLQSNNPLYNIHSIIRFVCFSYFFTAVPYTSTGISKYIIPIVSILIIIINFGFIENFGNPDHLSGNLLSAEAYMLLVYCMQYYLSKLKNEEDDVTNGADFWVVTGLAIYVVINFFVFLFYVPMLQQDVTLAINIWYLHNVAYIVLCIFITKAFYEPARYKYSI